MCQIVEEYAKKYAEKYAEKSAKEQCRQHALKMIANGKLSFEEIAEITSLTLEK